MRRIKVFARSLKLQNVPVFPLSIGVSGQLNPSRRLYTDLQVLTEDPEDFGRIRRDAFIYAERSQNPVSLKQMLLFGRDEEKFLELAKFLHLELPIRLARRVIELENLPYNLSKMPSVEKVHGWYLNSFSLLRSTTIPQNLEEAKEFKDVLERILTKHNNVVPTLAKGIIELKQIMGDSEEKIVDHCPFLQDFLDRFFMARIGIRILIGHYTALFDQSSEFVGMFEKNCSVKNVVQNAIDDAAMVCDQVYGSYPDVEIRGKKDIAISYIPGHIHHIVFELLKNSMRAVVEAHGNSSKELPPIQIFLNDGEDDISIKISDLGNGIPRSVIKKIFAYSYTTVKNPPDLIDDTQAPQLAGLTNVPMAGYGYGLPLSRLYAHAFGGDLVVVSMHGRGTDAFLYLNKLHESTEVVPR